MIIMEIFMETWPMKHYLGLINTTSSISRLYSWYLFTFNTTLSDNLTSFVRVLHFYTAASFYSGQTQAHFGIPDHTLTRP